MKTIIASTAIALALASAAAAENFKANSAEVNFTSGNLSFSADTVENGDTTVGAGIAFLNGEFAGFSGGADASFDYNIDSDDVELGVGYGVSRQVGTVVVHGDLGTTYTFTDSRTDFWTVEPSVGASYALNDTFNTYSEVGYEWNATDDWKGTGGYVEAGVDISITETVSVTPSVTRTFDTADNKTNANVALNFAF